MSYHSQNFVSRNLLLNNCEEALSKLFFTKNDHFRENFRINFCFRENFSIYFCYFRNLFVRFFRIRNADPDPGGLKRAEMKKKRSKKPDN
jgi:hypothetical protein